MFLCVQDLTCPGASLIHSAGIAARVPGNAGIEANARQFVPAANAPWEARFPGLFTIHGGVMQGIGATLYEFVSYDDEAQPLTESFMDYTVPTAREWIPLELAHQDTPSPFTPLGTKGVGESGISSPPGAIAAAIEDALPHLDLRLTELPFTPSRVWSAIQAAEPR